ncbi:MULTISPECIES: YkvA family protein [unclassified Corallococcus]|uniref:YkvA family protein n=1 Tax=unclassified Corallococcus TaxID=2685029 RepID=UPI001F5D7861|nr:MULTISPECIES: YkvA family protein [unclassified Corallococcus]WAS87652.1 YkvA family protein [Corallococcus sp. NCRR]
MGTRFFSYVRDPQVATWRKLAGLLAVLYFVSPVDAIPDFIPVVGWLDDLGVLSAAAFFMVREVQRWRPGTPAGVPSFDGLPRDEEGRAREPALRRHS